MNAVIVGADRLGNIPDVLAALGVNIQRHITGRAPVHQRTLVALPKNTQLLILLTDFLNHNAMKSYRSQAQMQGIPVIACRRSSSCLMQAVKRFLGLGGPCEECTGARMN